MKTTYPVIEMKDEAAHEAYLSAEHRRTLKSPVFNRLRITECVRAFNRNVKESGKPITRHRMTMTKLAATIFPDKSVSVASQYLAQYNSGDRFTCFDVSVILLIAKALKCQPCDLLEELS
jgi:hypothetical protein